MDTYPKGMPVATAGPLEQHWTLTSDRQRQDHAARIAWAHRCEIVEAEKRAEQAVAELEAQTLARAKELEEESLDFVVAGISEAPEIPPSTPSGASDCGAQRDPQPGSEGVSDNGGGAAAERFNITPRGTGGVILDKLAGKVDRMRPTEVQVCVRIGMERVDEEEADDAQASTSSRRRGRPRSATPDGIARRRSTPMRSLFNSVAIPSEPLDGPEPAVWQGDNTDALELGAGVAMRVGKELRRGPQRPKDPTRLTRREYLMSRTLDNDILDARRPIGAPQAAAQSAGSSDEEEARVQAPREPNWMDDARALPQPSATEEEQRQLHEWYNRGRGRHYAFEAKILEAKARSAWGDNNTGVPGRRAPVPVLPQKNSRNALLSQAAALASQGATAVQRTLQKQKQKQQTTEKHQRGPAGSARLGSTGASRLDGFAVRTGGAAARRTRLELASQALQQHVKSQVLTHRARMAPNPNSPTRAGPTRMSGLPLGGGSRRLVSAGSAAATNTAVLTRANSAPRTPVIPVRG